MQIFNKDVEMGQMDMQYVPELNGRETKSIGN
jgi:hypothetical protein